MPRLLHHLTVPEMVVRRRVQGRKSTGSSRLRTRRLHQEPTWTDWILSPPSRGGGTSLPVCRAAQTRTAGLGEKMTVTVVRPRAQPTVCSGGTGRRIYYCRPVVPAAKDLVLAGDASATTAATMSQTNLPCTSGRPSTAPLPTARLNTQADAAISAPTERLNLLTLHEEPAPAIRN